jgi:hypothetical protein
MKPDNRLQMREKNQRRLIRLFKKIYQPMKFRPDCDKTILFIFGCQRSGTTLLQRGILTRDLNTCIYQESSKISLEDDMQRLRLKPLNRVKKIIEQDCAPFIVLKPLVESQHSQRLLAYFEGSRALWMYRHYKDSVLSLSKHFGYLRLLNMLRALVRNEKAEWISEHVPGHIRNIAAKYFAEDMLPYDAAALFWFVRNSLFFELNLDRHPAVKLCRYEDLIRSPLETVQGIYEFADQEFPGKHILTEVRSTSLGKGKSIRLSPETDCLCRELQARLDGQAKKSKSDFFETVSSK